MARQLLKGNEAIAEAATRAGVEAYFGYPITPQTEVLEYLSRRMPELGHTFLQAESEVAAINMVYGAACTGARVMSSSSSPGVSLMMEGISYVAGAEVPMVLVDVMRGGPGLGNIGPSQGDYNQIVHGGGHGDYKPIVLAPASVQEAIDFMGLAFNLAEKYRAIVIVLVDGNIGQMMEPAELPPMRPEKRRQPDWAVSGSKGRDRRVLSSIYMNPEEEEAVNLRILERWGAVEANEIRYEEHFLEEAEFATVGFGTAGRVSFSAVRAAREEGLRVGLFRPITLNPFPFARLKELAEHVKGMLVVEMNAGQMLDDVLRAVGSKVRVEFYGRLGGMVPFPDEVLEEIRRMAGQPVSSNGSPRRSWLKRLEVIKR